MGKISDLKCNFKEFSGEKTDFSTRGLSRVVDDCYRSTLIPRKHPCPKKFLVTRLEYERYKHTKTKACCKNISCSFICSFIFLFFVLLCGYLEHVLFFKNRIKQKCFEF